MNKKLLLTLPFVFLLVIGIASAGDVTPTCSWTSGSPADGSTDTDGIFVINVTSNVNTTESAVLTIKFQSGASVTSETGQFSVSEVIANDSTNSTIWSFTGGIGGCTSCFHESDFKFTPTLTFSNGSGIDIEHHNLTALTAACSERQVNIDVPGGNKPTATVIAEATKGEEIPVTAIVVIAIGVLVLYFGFNSKKKK